MTEPKAPLISLSEPLLGEEEIEAVQRVIRSGWLTLGPETEAFEREFAERMGVKFAIALANGTAALHLAYLAAGLSEGDEFLLPALTFARHAQRGAVSPGASGSGGLRLGERPHALTRGP